MEHFYQDIPGWFSYEYVYKDMIKQALSEAAGHLDPTNTGVHFFISIP
jgi:hypothetical protein